MNHFKVVPDKAGEFETAWRERDTFLADTAGFEAFKLLRGPEEDGLVLYASHTVWRDEPSFRAWLDSEAFKKAHAQGKLRGVIAGPPKFIGWTEVDLAR